MIYVCVFISKGNFYYFCHAAFSTLNNSVVLGLPSPTNSQLQLGCGEVYTHVLSHICYKFIMSQSQVPKDNCTGCMRRHRCPYNSRCHYMKLAMDKCVELRVPTLEYVLHLLDLDDAWEQPPAGDQGEGDDCS